MSRPLVRWAAYIQLCLMFISGCAPTQPFFIAKNNALGEYLDQAMAIEYADVHVESLPEATQVQIPFGPSHLPDNFVDMTLEDCISIALQNTKILRVVNGSNQQSGSISGPLLSAGPGQMPSVYDAAIAASTASTQPLSIDNNGNRIPLRGAVRSNQVGGIEDALSEFDAQFSALAGYNTTDRPRNVGSGNIFNPQFFQAIDANAQAALSKKTATGGVVTSRLTSVYSSNNIPASGNILGSGNFGRSVPSDYTIAAEVQMTHPLMRGRGTLVNRIPIVLARINEDLALHEFEGNVTNLVKAVEDAYWDLYAGYRVFDSNKKALEASLNLWRVAQTRFLGDATDATPEAEAQARALYHQFEGQLHASLNGSTVPGNDPRGLRGREQILREKMGWSPTDGQFVRPIDNPTVARIEFNWCDVTAEGLTRNVYLRRQKWGIKQRELELVSAKNQILPQVDVTGFYRWVGVGDEFAAANRTGIRFPNPGSTALEELTGGAYQEAGARLEITPPAFGARRQLANIQSGRLQVSKSIEELKEKELFLVHELSFAWRNMESTFMSMKHYSDWWQANENEIKIYRDRILGDVGDKSQLFDNLLRAEQRRAQAETQYHQAVTEYNKSIVNVHYLKGSLMDLNSVTLQEGQWVDKAYWDAQERARERDSGTYLDYGYTRPAVVSRGPVESGMPTEGNPAHPGMDQQPVPESVEEEESKGDKDDKNQKKSGDKAPIASNYWSGFGASDSALPPPTVVTSSGQITKSVQAASPSDNSVSNVDVMWQPKPR